MDNECLICGEEMFTTDELNEGIHASCYAELGHCPFCGEAECVCFDEPEYTIRGTNRAKKQFNARHGMRVNGRSLLNPVFRSSL